MSTQIQFRRGTTTDHAAFAGAVGEVTVDATKSTAVVHDGATAGGHPLLREDMANVSPAGGRTALGLGSAALASLGTGDGQVPTADQIPSLSVLGSSLRNLLIGGDAGTNPWQRGTSVSLSGSGPRAYTADRWVAWGTGSGVAMAVSKQSSGITGFPFCFRLQRTAGNANTGALGLAQVVESINVIPYQGKTLTLSFQARHGANFSAAANALAVTIITGTSTDEGSAAAIAGTWSGQINTTETKTLTTVFQTVTTAFTLPADATELAVSFSYAPTGTAGAADYLEVACVELDAYGATSFEVLPGDAVLERCLRYYEVVRMADINGTGCPSGQISWQWQWKTNKRTVPTVLTINFPAAHIPGYSNEVTYSPYVQSSYATNGAVTGHRVSGYCITTIGYSYAAANDASGNAFNPAFSGDAEL